MSIVPLRRAAAIDEDRVRADNLLAQRDERSRWRVMNGGPGGANGREGDAVPSACDLLQLSVDRRRVFAVGLQLKVPLVCGPRLCGVLERQVRVAKVRVRDRARRIELQRPLEPRRGFLIAPE